MHTKRYILWMAMGVSIALLFVNCKKEEEEEPCTSWPCEDMTNHPHQVAYNPPFRIGTWVNVTPNVPAPDTLVFHNDSILSRWNSNGGMHYAKYDFWFVYLRVFKNVYNEEIDPPYRYETHYDGSTGRLYIHRGLQPFLTVDEYVKLD